MNITVRSLQNTGWRPASRQPGGDRLLKRHRSFGTIIKEINERRNKQLKLAKTHKEKE